MNGGGGQPLGGGASSAVTKGARVVRSSNQSINSTTYTAIQFTAATEAGGEFWDVANDTRITILETGYYCIAALLTWAAGITEQYADLYLNGTSIIGICDYGIPTPPQPRNMPLIVRHFTAGDYIELRAWHNSGSAKLCVDASVGITKVLPQ